MIIRPIVNDDLPKLVAFLCGCYPQLRSDHMFTEQFYRWKYFDLAGRETGYPAGFVAEDERKLVGFIGCMPFFLQYEHVSYPAGWIADWRLDDSVRGQGIGQQLLQAMITTIPAVACINGSLEAQRLYRRYGFQVWESGQSWIRVLRPAGYVFPVLRGLKKLLVLRSYAKHAMTRTWFPTLRAVKVGEVLGIAAAEVLLSKNHSNGLHHTLGYFKWMERCPVGQTELRPLLIGADPIGYVFLLRGRDNYARHVGRVVDLQVYIPEYVSDAWAAVVQHLLRASPPLDYLETITHSQIPNSLGFAVASPRLFWLKTRSFLCPDSTDWSVSLLDKDNAWRRLYIIQ